MQSRTVEKIICDRRNGITFLRLLLSLLVMFSHSYVLGGFGPDPLHQITHGQDDLGKLAVKSFMVLSGLLVSASFERQSLKNYFSKRFLRIFPGYWACLLFIVFLVGPIVTLLSQRNLLNYFTIQPNGSLRYLFLDSFLVQKQQGILHLLSKNPFPHVFDGSTWTLFPEFKGYFVIALCGVLGLLNNFRWLLLPFGFFYVFSLFELYYPTSTFTISSLLNPSGLSWGQDKELAILFLRLALYMISGMLLYSLSNKLVVNQIGAIVSIAVFVLCILLPIYNLLMPFVLGYLLLVIGHLLPTPLKDFDKVGDYSYGIYLYHFPIFQVLSLIGLNRLGLFPYFTIALALTVPIAVLSWKKIEHPALKFNGSQINGFQNLFKGYRLRIKDTDLEKPSQPFVQNPVVNSEDNHNQSKNQ